MLAPIDKWESGGNDIIQIVVTTRCDRNCSNCTQLLPFRLDYAFMSLECFEEAVVSVKEWPGLVALFGGNPSVHPQFPELCKIISKYIAPEHRGLWTNRLFKHGQVAAETFGRGKGRFNAGGLNLNAHANPVAAEEMDFWFPGRVIPQSVNQAAKHSAILIDRRDMGVTDEQWPAIRERCDINRDWSGAIVQREGKAFAYFCEVAAALDGIRGTNNGIPALPGWWRSRMSVFEGQVKNCCDQGCGYPLRDAGALDTDEVYNVSASWRAKLPVDAATLAEPTGQNCARGTDYMQVRRK